MWRRKVKEGLGNRGELELLNVPLDASKRIRLVLVIMIIITKLLLILKIIYVSKH